MADLTPDPIGDDAVIFAVAELLAELGWAWRPTSAFAPGDDVGIQYRRLGDGPDRAVAIAVYGGGDDDETGEAYRLVQLRFRGAPHDLRGADLLAGAAFNHLRTVAHRRGIAWARRRSFDSSKADDNGREQRTDNYRITLDNPEATPS